MNRCTKKQKAREARARRWEYVHGRGCVVHGCPARDAVEHSTPSQRIVSRQRMVNQRRDPQYAWFYAHPWAERNFMRQAVLDRRPGITLEQLEASMVHEEAKDARRMARSLKRRRKP